MLHLHILWLLRLIHVDVDGLPHDQAEDPLLGELLRHPGVPVDVRYSGNTNSFNPEPNSSHANPAELLKGRILGSRIPDIF